MKTRILMLVLAFVCGLAVAEDKPCTIHAKGQYYDLNPLQATSEDYDMMTDGGHHLKLNVCHGVKTETFGLQDDIGPPADISGFLRKDHGDFVIGKVNTTLSVFDSNPRMVLSGGSRCRAKREGDAGESQASSLISFICDTSVNGKGQPRLLAYLPPGDEDLACAFIFEWRTTYACPTTESGIIWRIFVGLIVVLLVILMTYTVLGTLYNRFVLQLRGFDQIPQFSIESMRYHSREAIDWIKDILAGMNIGQGRSVGGVGSDGGGLPFGGLGGGPTNPVSHQAQSAGFGNENYQPDGGFIRPQQGRTRTSSASKINPVSHQSQVSAAEAGRAFSLSSSPLPPKKDQSMPKRFDVESRGSTREEMEFMLGEDEDEGEELADISRPSPPGASDPSPESSPAESGRSSAGSSGPNSGAGGTNAAALRGRDLGDEGVIRL